MAKLREDLALTAYAIMLGLKVTGHHGYDLERAGAPGLFNADGIPHDSVQFEIGDMHVWETARGWRVGRLVNDAYEKPSDSDFYAKLKPALDEAARNWRDR